MHLPIKPFIFYGYSRFFLLFRPLVMPALFLSPKIHHFARPRLSPVTTIDETAPGRFLAQGKKVGLRQFTRLETAESAFIYMVLLTITLTLRRSVWTAKK